MTLYSLIRSARAAAASVPTMMRAATRVTMRRFSSCTPPVVIGSALVTLVAVLAVAGLLAFGAGWLFIVAGALEARGGRRGVVGGHRRRLAGLTQALGGGGGGGGKPPLTRAS